MLTMIAHGAVAQTDAKGRQVTRIVFDREQVSIEYADGSTETGVSEAAIVNDKRSTGIKAVMTNAGTSARRWYTIDGRALQGQPQQKGIYVVREKNGVRKTIKK